MGESASSEEAPKEAKEDVQRMSMIEFIRAGEEAKTADQRNETRRAIMLYEKSIDLGRQALKLPNMQQIHIRSIQEISAKFERRLADLTVAAAQSSRGAAPSSTRRGANAVITRTKSMTPTVSPLPSPSSSSSRRPITSPAAASASKRTPLTDVERDVLDTVVDKSPSVSWDDIIGLEEPKQCLLEMVVLPNLNPGVFSGLRTPPKGLLLFGPPGNGKTFIAKAVASQCKATFFSCSASTMTSKWHGEGEKICRALFSIARKAQPSVIFMDEIDSLLSARGGSQEHDASRRLKTEFLVQFDGVSSSSEDKVVVLGATNRPFDLDEAVLRRFAKRIYIPLPCPSARKHLIQQLLTQNGSHLSDYEMREVVKQTDGHSASDLTSLCREASLVALREIDPSKIATVTKDQIRAMTVRDFQLALRKIRPSCSKEGLRELEQWNSRFGS